MQALEKCDVKSNKSRNSTQALFCNHTGDIYSDDIVGAASCRKEELEALLTLLPTSTWHLNSLLLSLKKKIPFLYITLHISDTRILTSVHYKDTDTHNYFHFSSFHPQHCKCSIPFSQFLCLHHLYSSDVDFLV